nr:immunoglobulin heavy chain junction region [Mus musculus]MBK4183767.1 immunoglobulin heavy chain junction region [Mus musculus]
CTRKMDDYGGYAMDYW